MATNTYFRLKPCCEGEDTLIFKGSEFGLPLTDGITYKYTGTSIVDSFGNELVQDKCYTVEQCPGGIDCIPYTIIQVVEFVPLPATTFFTVETCESDACIDCDVTNTSEYYRLDTCCPNGHPLFFREPPIGFLTTGGVYLYTGPTVFDYTNFYQLVQNQCYTVTCCGCIDNLPTTPCTAYNDEVTDLWTVLPSVGLFTLQTDCDDLDCQNCETPEPTTEYYTLNDCCTGEPVEYPDNFELQGVIYLLFNGDCVETNCPDDLIGLIITTISNEAAGGLFITGCLELTEIPELEIPIGTITSPYENILDEVVTVSTCEDCQTCPTDDSSFRLEDCAGVLDDIITNFDLTDLVGEVITIKDEDNKPLEGCWRVFTIPFVEVEEELVLGVYKCYEECEDCLPTPPHPFPLKPRTVDPNYTTGNCDPEIVEETFCKNGENQYKKVLNKRFGIQDCCPEDEDKIYIQKEKIKLLLIKGTDPTPDPCSTEPIINEYYLGRNDGDLQLSLSYTDINGFNVIITIPACTGICDPVRFCAVRGTITLNGIITYAGNESCNDSINCITNSNLVYVRPCII